MKTATIERYHVYGTRNYMLRVMYRGLVLRWWEKGYSVHANMLDCGRESIEAAKQHARNQGFTHCRFVGDWSYSTKPRGGAL